LLGWLFYGQLPDGLATVGMVIVAGSGLAVAVAERQRVRGEA